MARGDQRSRPRQPAFVPHRTDFVDSTQGVAGHPFGYARERFGSTAWERITIGGYWFNPGSSDQIFVGLIGVTL